MRCVRSVFVPEYGSCFLVFEGPSPEAVVEASRRAELDVEHIEEARGDGR